MTFYNLIALHNSLLKNDDPTALQVLHLTLTTRPNCTLRLKSLVQAASNGKGLSVVQVPSSLDQSQAGDNDDNVDISGDISSFEEPLENTTEGQGSLEAVG